MREADLRTVLVIVVTVTSLSLAFTGVMEQLALNLAVTLLLVVSPGTSRWHKLGRRIRGLGRLILALFIAQVLFRRDGHALWSWGWLRVTDTGLETGAASGLRFLLILLSAGLLFDYPYHRWLQALRAWKLPYEFAFLVANVMHFVPMLDDQVRLSRDALRLRGIELGALPIGQRITAYRTLVLPIIARTLHQVRFRAISLELRGFRLSPVRTELTRHRLNAADIVLQLQSLLIAGGLLVLRGMGR